MIFRRSSSGLSNQPRFFGVDLIAYLEGTRDLRPRLELGEGEAQSLDALFWSEVLTATRGNVSVHFKEMGSKSALMDFAGTLNKESKGKVLVCVDRDFDDLKPGSENARFCLAKTWSYSWESDVWGLGVVIDSVEKFIPVATLPPAVNAHLVSVWKSFYARIGRFVLLDAKFVSMGEPALIDRDSPAAPVLVARDAAPRLNDAYFATKITVARAKHARPWSCVLAARVEADRHLFGKSAWKFGYHLVIYALRHCGIASQLSSEAIDGFAIRIFGNRLAAGHETARLNYYNQEFANAGV